MSCYNCGHDFDHHADKTNHYKCLYNGCVCEKYWEFPFNLTLEEIEQVYKIKALRKNASL